VTTSNGSPRVVASLGRALARRGIVEEARKIREELKRISRKNHVSAYYMALLCDAMGDRDRAFEHLEVAFQRRDGDLIFIKVDDRNRGLRDDERFQSIVRRMRFPEEQ